MSLSSAIDMPKTRIEKCTDLPEFTNWIECLVEFEQGLAGVSNVAHQAHPGGPIDDTATDRCEPLNLPIPDRIVDRDIAGRWTAGVFPVRKHHPILVSFADRNRIGSGARELSCIRAKIHEGWIEQGHGEIDIACVAENVKASGCRASDTP